MLPKLYGMVMNLRIYSILHYRNISIKYQKSLRKVVILSNKYIGFSSSQNAEIKISIR